MKKRIIRKLAEHTLEIVIVDAVIVSLALYAADSAGKPALYYEGKMPGFLGRVKEAFKDYVGEFHPAQFFTTDLGHVIKRMKYKAPEGNSGRPDIVQEKMPMPATLIFDGFSLKYSDNAHRWNVVEAGVDGIEYDPEKKRVSGFFNAAFDGGDWSRIDSVEYNIEATPVLGGNAAFVHGSERLTLEAGRARAVMELDLESMGLAGFDDVTVFMRGFRFEANEEFPDGLNPKGIAVKTIPVGRKGNILELDITAELKAGEVAFRKGPGYFYRTDATVFYTVAGVNGGEFRRAWNHYMLLNRERAPESVRMVKANLAPGPGTVVPVIQGFQFDVHSTKARFLREVAMALENPEYDETTGEAGVLCSGYLSNDGTFPGALDVRFNADLLFMKLPGAETAGKLKTGGVSEEVTATKSIEIDASFC